MMKTWLLAFIPIFVAVDAIGILPIFISLTSGLKKKDKTRIVVQSVITALCLAVSFIFLGTAVFKFLNITIADFMIAGGAILFCIAIRDILVQGKVNKLPLKELGAVPIGTPLLVGPAVAYYDPHCRQPVRDLPYGDVCFFERGIGGINIPFL
jgi:multiple antibiotic resistance protein